MRISTNSLYESNVSRIGDTQSSLAKVQQQIASGKRLLSPADDPLGAAKALDLTQGQAMNAQQTENRSSARSALSMQEGALQSVTSLLQDVRSQVVAAGSGTLDDASRKFIAGELRSRLSELTSLANSRDGVGNYLFAGFKDSAQPFNSNGGAVSYAGDNGQKLLQVGMSRQMPAGDSGDAIFMNVPASAVFTSTGTGTGSATLSNISIKDASQAVPGHQYEVVFDADAGGAPTYSVYDTTKDPNKKAAPLATGAYASPQTIQAAGLEMTVSGTPDSGDALSIRPARAQSMFKTLDKLIVTLEAPVSTEAERKQFTYDLGVAGQNIDNALNNVLSVRASVGSRLQELDTLDDAGSARDLQYAEQLSDIQDVDYVKAVTDLTQKQMQLQAAQQSFVKVSGLSLFNFL
jgi:flagellar hook-associated protein 3 FlgL